MQYTLIGLGNPGEAYAHTRHNVGKLSAELFSEVHTGVDVVYVHSNEYMNNSGRAVARAIHSQTEIERLIVVHDDIDLPFGTVRVAFGRGSGGHNGIQSIIDTMNTKNFIRVRVGVAKKNIFGALRKPKGEKAVHEFLLSEMKPRDFDALRGIVKEKVVPALEMIVKGGKEKAMRVVNSK